MSIGSGTDTSRVTPGGWEESQKMSMRYSSLLLVLISLVFGCTSDPGATTNGAATNDSGATAQEPHSDSQADPQTRVVSWRQTPGLVPVEMARSFQKFPYRFSLFGDGTVIFRDESFVGHRVVLTPEELAQFWRQVSELSVKSLQEDELPAGMREGGAVIMDAGTEEFAVQGADGAARLSVSASVRYWCQQHPDNHGLAAWGKLAELLRQFDHPRAVPWQPEQE